MDISPRGQSVLEHVALKLSNILSADALIVEHAINNRAESVIAHLLTSTRLVLSPSVSGLRQLIPCYPFRALNAQL